MAYKPLKEKEYRKYLKMVGNWRKGILTTSSGMRKDSFYARSKLPIARMEKRELLPIVSKKTMQEFKNRGWEWPPKKK